MTVPVPDVLLLHVVAMCPWRATREALKVSVDKCVLHRIPPVPLCVNPAFRERLAHLFRARHKMKIYSISCATYDPATQVLIRIFFSRASLEYTMFVDTHVSRVPHSRGGFPVMIGFSREPDMSTTRAYVFNAQGACKQSRHTYSSPIALFCELPILHPVFDTLSFAFV